MPDIVPRWLLGAAVPVGRLVLRQLAVVELATELRKSGRSLLRTRTRERRQEVQVHLPQQPLVHAVSPTVAVVLVVESEGRADRRPRANDGHRNAKCP